MSVKKRVGSKVLVVASLLLLSSLLAGCGQAAPAIHVLHVEARYGSPDGPRIPLRAAGFACTVHNDPALDELTATNVSDDPTLSVQDCPSVRVFVEGRRDCTQEASEEIFLPAHRTEQNVTVVLYDGLRFLGQTYHFVTNAASVMVAAPFDFPKGQEAAYLHRLDEGNATATWMPFVAQGNFRSNFAVGFSLDGGAPRNGAFGGGGRADTTLGYEASRAARNATLIAATLASDGPVVAPNGIDVSLHGTLYFTGSGREIEHGTSYGPHRSCLESP